MNDNDEERVIVEVPAHEPEPARVLITRRILLWAVVVGVGALLFSVWLGRPDCDLPEYSDRYLTLTRSSITFGTGGTSFVTYKILGIEKEQEEGVDTITLHFRDVAGTKFERKVVADPSGSRLHFVSQPAVVWQRFQR